MLSFFLETNAPLETVLSTSVQTWGVLAFVGYISTLIAFAIWGKLLKSYSAAVVTPFALLIPVVGLVTSSLMLNESLTRDEILGAVLILLGLVFCVAGKKSFILIAKYRGAK
ncbi:EamA family transporter [Shewanella denitrificans]|uniref:EamA family transporter n=1 Tax=Shewanella denitrificans TaxID=192073 RepID=UPI000055661D|nr:EamA family transporter [Shewanella denitrificans]